MILSLFLVSLFAILSFALPSITYVSPTLSDNATTGSNWVYVNVTSSENLNQSLLEWGNSTGFTNVSMSNSSMTNWYRNMTGLSDGTYNYTIWAENTTGGWNQTQRRFVGHYNYRRLHQGIGYLTPAEVYFREGVTHVVG